MPDKSGRKSRANSKYDWVFCCVICSGSQVIRSANRTADCSSAHCSDYLLLCCFVTSSRLLRSHRTISIDTCDYALFGLGVALLPTIGKYRTGWQLPVHLIDIGVVSILTYFIQSVSAAFFILYVFVLMSATFRWNWRGALWTTFALPALQLIFFSSRARPLVQFIVEWSFLLMIGGVFVFFGVSRERSAERLTQIADWPTTGCNRTRISTTYWLDASLRHIATVLQAPRVLVLWEIAQEPYWFSALFADGKCQHDRTIANAWQTGVYGT